MYENIIVIPYRNRKTNLDYFIKNTVPLIETLMSNTKVIVIEQNEGKLFNRGKVLNVGFKEYQHETEYFITHDVDINPTKLCIETYYNKNITDEQVMGIYTSKCNTLGGIIKIKSKCIHKINGFPNNFWGWGIEDKALQNRSEFYNISKITNLTNKTEHPEFFKIFDHDGRLHGPNYSNHQKQEYRQFGKIKNEEKKKHIMNSGLNTIEYNILERKQLHMIVELIKVDI